MITDRFHSWEKIMKEQRQKDQQEEERENQLYLLNISSNNENNSKSILNLKFLLRLETDTINLDYL